MWTGIDLNYNLSSVITLSSLDRYYEQEKLLYYISELKTLNIKFFYYIHFNSVSYTDFNFFQAKQIPPREMRAERKQTDWYSVNEKVRGRNLRSRLQHGCRKTYYGEEWIFSKILNNFCILY